MADINNTSIASTVNQFVSDLEKYVLDSKEALNTAPSSFVGLLSSTLAKTSAYSYFNMLMSKREITPSTAILMKSLMRQLTSDKLNDIYGSPSDITLVISYPERDIIDAAIADGSGKFKLTLNKGAKFTFSGYPTFTLDYNINIFVTRYYNSSTTSNSIYAMYDVDDNEAGSVITCSDPYITSRNDIVINNQKHFTMYVKVKQFERNYSLTEMSGEASNIDITYSNSLMGFVVLYRPQGYGSYYAIDTYLEGESSTSGVSYSLSDTNGTKSIRLKFSKLPDSFNPTNGTIKVVYYTTSGEEGNFDLGEINETTISDLSMEYAQDISDEYQEALVNIVPTISVFGTSAENGSNSKTLEEVRTLVAESGNGEVITPSTLSSAALKRGFSTYIQRHDLLSFEFMLTSFLKYGSNIIPTKMIDGFFSFADVDVDTESNARIISPSDVFRYDEDTQKYKLIKYEDLESYSEYYEEYKKDPTTDYSFPYFIRISNGSNMAVSAYDESINETKSTRFTFLAQSVLDKASIISMKAYRNPLSLDTITYTDDLVPVIGKDTYQFTFNVNTSASIVTHLQSLSSNETPYVKFRLIFRDTTDSAIYAADVKLSECVYDVDTITCNCFLKTSSSILSSGKIKISDNSLKSLPYSSSQYSFYYIDGTVNVDICVIFKETEDGATRQVSSYDSYLTDAEISNGYYMGIIYTADNVVLAKDMSDNIDINSDIKLSQPEYQVAEEDIPDTYSANEYKMNGSEYVMEEQEITLPDGSTSVTNSFVLVHEAGDTKQTLNGCVGSYNTLSTSKTWRWSRDGSTGDSVYNDGDLLNDEPINAIVQWNNLVLFGGGSGRIGCYDITSNTWYSYDNTTAYRGEDDTSGYVITNDGSAMGEETIRGMTVLQNTDGKDILFVFGDKGHVASCDLSSNTWKAYDTSGGNNIAIYSNNGSCMGGETIYACETYTNSDDETVLVLGGGSGRVCSFVIDRNAWYNYDRSTTEAGKLCIYSDGAIRNYKAILSMKKYLESGIYCTGIDGICSILDLTTGGSSLLNDGTVVDNKVMYACTIIGNLFIIAGKDGYVANYNIVRSSWTKYNDGSGICSSGYEMGNESIHAILSYGVNIIFAGGLGRICCYDTTTSSWERYDGSGIVNDGEFITNTISCISYDTVEGDSVMYFGGSNGNITYKYRKGDYILDSNGNYIIKKGSSQVAYLKGIPAYSRIFAVDNIFDTIITSYSDLVRKIAAMSNVFVDGCSLHLGVKTTSGKSTKFYFLNNKTSEKTYLDSLCISLSLGVKFQSNITSSNAVYLISTIKEEILDYINTIQEDTTTNTIELNIYEMLDSIKTSVPGIEYFEYYALNDYDSTECQTIFYTKSSDSSDNEYLCIETSINEDESSIDERMVEFEPNIQIALL